MQPFVQSFALCQERWILGWAKQSQFGNRSDGRAGPQIVGKCSTRLIDATLHAVSDGDLLAIIVQGGLLFEPSVHFRSG